MTPQIAFTAKYGDPQKMQSDFERKYLTVWLCQSEFPSLPFKRIYCNKDLIVPLRNTFKHLQDLGLLKEIKTFDGCFLVREIRGVKGVLSVHSWAMAVDFNASDNPLGMTRQQCIDKGLKPFSEAFLKAWRDTGWVLGADFSRSDLMHMEWTKGLYGKNL